MAHAGRAPLADQLRARPQYLLPRNALTALAHGVSNCRAGWVRRPLISAFSRMFRVDLSETESPAGGYRSFDEFFTRALKPGARPLAGNPPDPVCPCDGTVSQLGRLDADRLIQAKGLDYTAGDLLGSPDLAPPFQGGRFLTVYLAPADYHRVHMPITARLLTEVRVPGRLFSVSESTTRVIPQLFARNERMAAVFDTAFGPLAVVMVAAMLVAGIETVWDPQGVRRPGDTAQRRHFSEPVRLERGAELGRFHWGSTVILLTTDAFPPWADGLQPGSRVRMGQAICQPGGTRTTV